VAVAALRRALPGRRREAHNICSVDPRDEVGRLSTDTVVQIAAEGRKYGLYLLTSTQRPHKVHENVVSQCDNLR
jgi:hypothetical protein